MLVLSYLLLLRYGQAVTFPPLSTIHIVSNTAELLQQIEQLNTVKQELTTEVIGFSFLFGDGFRVNFVL